MEALGLKRPWFSRSEHCVRFPDTKSGALVRALGEAAMDCIEAQPTQAGSLFALPADWGERHFISVVRILDRICRKARLENVPLMCSGIPLPALQATSGFPNLLSRGYLDIPRTALRKGMCSWMPHWS